MGMWPILIIAALIIFGVMIYNGLVKLREQVNGAWADVDVQLKRRYDLIPNIVETVKGYASHEKDTLEAVVNARSAAMAAQGPVEQGLQSTRQHVLRLPLLGRAGSVHRLIPGVDDRFGRDPLATGMHDVHLGSFFIGGQV